MASPRRTDDVKLSTVEAARVLGLSRKTTNRMCQGKYPLPEGWWSEQESRPQGTRWVLYCPGDDPRLALLDRDVPGGDGGDDPVGPAPPGRPDGPGDVVGAMLERLDRLDRQRDADLAALVRQAEEIGQLRAQAERVELLEFRSDGERQALRDQVETITRLQVERDQLDARLADRARELDRALADRALAEKRVVELAARVEQLRAVASLPWYRRLWLAFRPGTIGET